MKLRSAASRGVYYVAVLAYCVVYWLVLLGTWLEGYDREPYQ